MNSLSGINIGCRDRERYNKYAEAIEIEAFLLHLNDCIKYLSFKDAVIACKKCIEGR